jgi:hypothetical protein
MCSPLHKLQLNFRYTFSIQLQFNIQRSVIPFWTSKACLITRIFPGSCLIILRRYIKFYWSGINSKLNSKSSDFPSVLLLCVGMKLGLFTLREGLRLFQNWVLSRKFRHKRRKVIGCRRKPHKESLRNSYSSPNRPTIRRVRWVKYVACTQKFGNTIKSLIGHPAKYWQENNTQINFKEIYGRRGLN